MEEEVLGSKASSFLRFFFSCSLFFSSLMGSSISVLICFLGALFLFVFVFLALFFMNCCGLWLVVFFFMLGLRGMGWCV